MDSRHEKRIEILHNRRTSHVVGGTAGRTHTMQDNAHIGNTSNWRNVSPGHTACDGAPPTNFSHIDTIRNYSWTRDRSISVVAFCAPGKARRGVKTPQVGWACAAEAGSPGRPASECVA